MRTQVPKVEGDWLYQEVNEDRWFTKEALLPNNAPNLPECTESQKEEWEKQHQPQPEPEPEPQTEESVEQPTE